jgi:hypothetical protein
MISCMFSWVWDENIGCLHLTHSLFSDNSRAPRSFYLNRHNCDNLTSHVDLVTRTKAICDMYGVSMLIYILDNVYATETRKPVVRQHSDQDGLA